MNRGYYIFIGIQDAKPIRMLFEGSDLQNALDKARIKMTEVELEKFYPIKPVSTGE